MRSTDISKYFGSDSTAGGTQFVLRAIRDNADRQRACADSGGDPKDLALNAIGSKQSQKLKIPLFTQHITFSLVMFNQPLIDEHYRDGEVHR